MLSPGVGADGAWNRGPLKLLFMAEAVTLAHVARPLVLAHALAGSRYDITIACDDRYARFLEGGTWRRERLHSIPSQQFAASLAAGRRVYSEDELDAYVREDLQLFERVRPDLVIGDFRLSLAVSARVARIPYIAVSNAYWSPAHGGHIPVPVLPMSRSLPLGLAQQIFDWVRPLAFASHCRPMNRLRRRYGQSSLGDDLRRVYTEADHLLLADSPALFPIAPLPANHTFLGPLAWSPPVPLPAGWNEVDHTRPLIYVTLGSSGPPRALWAVLEALADQPVQLIVATAGHDMTGPVPRNVRLAHYLPGDQVLARAALMICNGGNLSMYQAIEAGVPMLGLASNLDQFLNMASVVSSGAGLMLRTDRLSTREVVRAVNQLLSQPQYSDAVRRLGSVVRGSPSVAEVVSPVIDRLVVSLGTA